MLRGVFIALMIVVNFILQSSVFANIAVGGVLPNLLIILTATYGFMNGENYGLFVGFFCGLLYDVFFGDVIGFYAIVYMYIGFLNGKFYRIFYPEDIKLPLALICASDLTYSFVSYVFLFLIGGRLQFGWYMLHIILPELVYTVAASIALYPVILLLERLAGRRERGRDSKFV